MINYLLHHYLEQTVAQYPQKTAIQSNSESITYQGLWEKSNQLANQLHAVGFEPKNTVGIYLPKSIEAVITLFAILKAGGIYIPLDSYYSIQSYGMPLFPHYRIMKLGLLKT